MSHSSYKKIKWENMGLCTNCGKEREDPEYKHCAKCRAQSREKRLKREQMGLCVSCGGLRLDPAWKNCARCRDVVRRKQFNKMLATKEPYTESEVKKRVQAHTVNDTHKCWTCEWGRFEGDRFFCPFAYGTCVKEGNV